LSLDLIVHGVQFSSVQDGISALGKPHNYALHSVSQKFPQRCLRNGSNVRLTDDGPLSSFQGRSSNASSFHASLLQAIDGVMSLRGFVPAGSVSSFSTLQVSFNCAEHSSLFDLGKNTCCDTFCHHGTFCHLRVLSITDEMVSDKSCSDYTFFYFLKNTLRYQYLLRSSSRWVFRAVLNAVADWLCLISRGREFQTEGAALLNQFI